jgi:hypothetical protein
VIYLVHYEQVAQLPMPGDGVPERQSLPIEGTLAGQAFRRVEMVTSPDTGRTRVWAPVLDGVERLGVAESVFPEPPGEGLLDQVHPFVALVAELIVTNDAYTDAFAKLRRRKRMTLAGEMQWELLPPLTFGTRRVVITGGLEPAYEVGGDSFDYQVTGDIADLLVIDAVGHGLPAAVLASVAISAYRYGRRKSLEVPDLAAEVNAAVADQPRPALRPASSSASNGWPTTSAPRWPPATRRRRRCDG